MKMFEHIITKLVNDHLFPLQNLSQTRIAELNSIKDKIYDNPKEVEMWFDKEINKIQKVDVSSTVNSLLNNK
jgi:hypothetical protein